MLVVGLAVDGGGVLGAAIASSNRRTSARALPSLVSVSPSPPVAQAPSSAQADGSGGQPVIEAPPPPVKVLGQQSG